MQLLPDWAPNVHPLIIHFPIVLLLIAVVADLSALLFKKADWLRKSAVSLYVLSALGAIVTYFTGKQAADIVTFPPPSYPVISKHADLALYTTLFFSIYALIRLFLFWKKWDTKRWTTGLLFLIAAGGYILVQQTAEQGGMLVYKYGVGTAAAKTDSVSSLQAAKVKAPEIVIADNGSWTWPGDDDSFQQFKLVQGQANNLRIQESANGNALTINVLSSKPFLLTFGPQLANVQLVAKVNLDNFKGRFLLVHHVMNSSRFGFLEIEANQATLGQVDNDQIRSFDSGKFSPQGWITLKAVSSSGHYRGYVNDKLIVHGHGSDLPNGTTGIAFSGNGSIQISRIEVVSLDKTPMMNMKQGHMEQGHMEQGHMEQGNTSHEESGEKHSH